MGKTVAELLGQLDSRELTEWEAYDRLDPIDHVRRQELAIATVAQTIANVHRNPNRDPHKASDFMTDWGAKERGKVDEADAPAIPLAHQVDKAMATVTRWETPEEKAARVQWELSQKQP